MMLWAILSLLVLSIILLWELLMGVQRQTKAIIKASDLNVEAHQRLFEEVRAMALREAALKDQASGEGWWQRTFPPATAAGTEG